MEDNQNTKKTEDSSTNEKFILEYPSNYEEIANKQLMHLELDYLNVVNSKPIADEGAKSDCSDSFEDQSPSPSGSNKHEDKQYYQCLNEEDEFIQVEENEEESSAAAIEEDKVPTSDTNTDPLEGLEFFVMKTKEDGAIEMVDNKFETIWKNHHDAPAMPKHSVEPLKNPEKIKEAMKKIQLQPPVWAKNLKDEDFLNIVKAKLSK